MNPRSKRVITALMLGLMLFGAGGYVGFNIGRSPSKPASQHGQVEEIASAASSNSSDAYSGSPHGGDYNLAAFILVGGELSQILKSIVGENWHAYHAYLLPDIRGFKLTIHYSPHVPSLTDMQHEELTKHLHKRLREETAANPPLHRTATGSTR